MIILKQTGKIEGLRDDGVKITLYDGKYWHLHNELKEVINNTLTPEEQKSQEEIEEAAEIKGAAIALRSVFRVVQDEDLKEFINFIPEWASDTEYITDDVVTFNGKIYRVLTDIISDSNYTPDTTNYQYSDITDKISSNGEILEWKPSQGYQDYYVKDDVVVHNGFKWKSTHDRNTWEPGTAGAPWVKVE